MNHYPEAAMATAGPSGPDSRPDSPRHGAIVHSLESLLCRRRQEAKQHLTLHKAALLAEPAALPNNQQQERHRLAALLGWPLIDNREHAEASAPSIQPGPDVAWAHVKQIDFEVIDGFHSCALVFLPREEAGSAELKPLLVVQHGGWGTPEVVSGMSGPDNYNGVVRQAVDRGWIVVLPQLLIWQEKVRPAISQFSIDLDLKQLGGSRVALDLRTLQRAAEIATDHFPVNPDRWSIAGLSYGGFYALLAGALDLRFRAVLSSCYVNDRFRYNWPDWVWSDSARRIDDAMLALLINPRPLWVEAGIEDEIFDIKTARPVLSEIAALYETLGCGSRVVAREFHGTHEFCPDFAGLDFLLCKTSV